VHFQDQAYRIEVRNQQPFIVDQSNNRVAVDQVIFDAYSDPSGQVAHGVIVAVQGLPQGVTQALDSHAARSLGVGTHLNSGRFRIRKGMTRWRATAEGFERATQK
jgi:hypothetical protein